MRTHAARRYQVSARHLLREKKRSLGEIQTHAIDLGGNEVGPLVDRGERLTMAMVHSYEYNFDWFCLVGGVIFSSLVISLPPPHTPFLLSFGFVCRLVTFDLCFVLFFRVLFSCTFVPLSTIFQLVVAS